MAREKGDVLAQLIEFAHRIRYEDLPEHVVHETKRRVIDALGCLLGSLQDQRVIALRSQLRKNALIGYPGGLGMGMSDRLPLDYAAFLNTAMIRWLDFNDTYLAREPAHPSDNLGLLAALCGPRKISGKDFIAAAALAYDIQCRLCEAASLRKRGWDHVNYILFSATLAGAKLLGMTREQMYDAVAFAVNSNIALRQAREGATLSEQKNMAAGDAVRAAAWALEKVKAGLHGPDDILYGKHGFVKQVSGRLRRNAFKGLGKRFLIADTYLKKYPVEYHGQTAVEHAIEFRKRLGRAPEPHEVEAIFIITYEAACTIIGGEEKRRPATKESADHSIYYVFAAALREGEMTLKQYRRELFADQAILATIDRMVIRERQEFTEAYNAPQGKRAFPSYAILLMKDGTAFTDYREYPYGHPKNPMTDEEVNEKFFSLANDVCAHPEKPLEQLWQLEQIPDLKAVLGKLVFYSLSRRKFL